MTLIPAGGLANRIYAIASAIGFCRDNNIRLKIIWAKDWGMGTTFHQILSLNPEIKNVEIINAKWYHWLHLNPRKGNLWLPALYQRLFFDVQINELKAIPAHDNLIKRFLQAKTAIHLISFSLFYEWEGMFDILKPLDIIQNQINKQTSIFANQRVIGIHIRRSDHRKSIEESSTDLFIDKINQEIENDSSTKFYLATDSEEEKQNLKKLFGSKIMFSLQKAKRGSESGIIHALIELFTLANTKKIYGSSGSTYSMLAAEIGNIPLEIVIKKGI